MSDDHTNPSNPSRRTMIKVAGTALVAVWSSKTIPNADARQAPAQAATGKTLLLAPEDATDAAVHSRVENLFWCDMMMEHAGFFAMLMPGPELATQRAQAENFQRTFKTQYDKAKTATFDKANSAAFNSATVELLKPFIEYKQRMRDAQEAGRIRTFVFPLFFDHTAREAERAVARLERLTAGNPALQFAEVVDFWSTTMSEDNEFIAHLLDPREEDLVSQALDSSAVFKGFNLGNHDHKVTGGEIVLATEELIDFETMIEDGVNTGRVKSILHPTMADHMRRETLKFVDELKRTGTRT